MSGYNSPFEFFRKHSIGALILLLLVIFAFTVGDSLQSIMSGGGTVPRMLIVITAVVMCGAIFWGMGLRREKEKEWMWGGAVLGLGIGFLAVTLWKGTTRDVVASGTFGNVKHKDVQTIVAEYQNVQRFIQLVRAEVDPYLTLEVPTQPADPGQNPRNFPGGIQGWLDATQKRREWETKWQAKAALKQAAETQLRGLIPNWANFSPGPRDPKYAQINIAVFAKLLDAEAESMGITISDDVVERFINTVTEEKLDANEFDNVVRKQMRMNESMIFTALKNTLRREATFHLIAPILNTTPATSYAAYRKKSLLQDMVVVPVPVEPFIAQVGEPSDADLRKFFDDRKEQRTRYGKFGFLEEAKVNLEYLQISSSVVRAQVKITEEQIKQRYDVLMQSGNLPYVDPLPQPKKPLIAPRPKKPETPKGPKLVPPTPGNSSRPAPRNTVPVALIQPMPPLAAPKVTRDPLVAPRPDVFNSGDIEPPVFPPLPKYAPLSQMRFQIREQLIGEEVRKEMGRIHGAVLAAAKKIELGDDLSADERSAKLKAIAEKYEAVSHASTGLMTRDQLEKRSVGRARIPEVNRTNPNATGTPVPDVAFAPSRGTEDFHIVRQAAMGAATNPSDLFVWWKIGSKPPAAPSFDDEKVQKAVREAWKEFTAREKAEERANAIAEQLRTKPKDKTVDDLIEGMTVTGDKDSKALTSFFEKDFRWLKMMGRGPLDPEPRFDAVGFSMYGYGPLTGEPGEGKKTEVGPDFMDVVFNKTKVDEFGVAPDRDKKRYYIVKVVMRDDVDDGFIENFPKRQGQFQDSLLYREVMQTVGQESQDAWVQKLEKKYDLKRFELPDQEN